MSVTLQQALAQSVRSRLAVLGKTQRQFAAEVGISEKHMSRLLTCREEGTLHMWSKLLSEADVLPTLVSALIRDGA